MLVHLRRISTVVAAVLVGLGLVVLDPHAPAAMAYQAPPPITWNPGAVGTQPNVMNPGQWDSYLNANPNKVVGNTATTGAGGGKVGLRGFGGSAAAAVGGFVVGTEIGTGLATALGLPTTGSFWCDLGALFGTCGAAASVDYVVNSDVAGLANPPGWATANHATVTLVGTTTYPGDYWADATVTVQVDAAPSWHESGSVSVTAVTSGICHDVAASTGGQGPGGLFVYGVPRTNPGVAPTVLSSASLAPSAGCTGAPQQRSRTLTVGSDWLFVRAEVVVGGQSVGEATYQPVRTLRWYPEASPERPPAVEPDPQRWWKSTWQCSAGTPGGSQQSSPFRESDPEWPGFPSAQCDPGAVVTSLLVQQITEGLTDAVTVIDWTADPGYVEWANSSCAGGGCTLLLSRIDQVTGARVSCFSNPTLCASWAADPAREQNYECTYGGSVVALEDCLVYAPTFQTGGANYADPEGNVDPDAGTDPGTDPGSDPGSEDCPPPFSWASAFNPWWYYKSTLCALEDAFVPTQSQVKVEQIGQALQTKTPVPELGSISQALAPPSSGSECLVLSLPIAFVIGHDQPLLDSCTWSDPVSRLLRDYRPLFTVVVWFTVIAPLAWWAWKTYAPGSTGTA
ncbi:hypothetical protein [Cellulomonas sp. ES6]|uniref:hypothetical protein n=1 Tax=Cellulomonas sp. ES6 TaxID=3039384 RepID=UPI0024B77D44|nr:hypothetical protein [Cellulomonas sp. ES6]WHP17852.1 hypothetical protein P9841_01385 [Cellulomonas sp. ES6]